MHPPLSLCVSLCLWPHCAAPGCTTYPSGSVSNESCFSESPDGFCWSAYCSDHKIHKGQTRDVGSGQENACGGCHSNTGPGQMSQALLTNSISISKLRLTQHTHTSIIFSNVKHFLFILLGTRWFISGWSIMSFFSSRTIFLDYFIYVIFKNFIYGRNYLQTT